MAQPNMTVAALDRWTSTEAFREYRAYRGAGTVDTVVARTRRVLAGRGQPGERKKVEQFIARHRAQQAGERKFGSGPSAVSAQTAALRNWGYDPTGRF